MPIYERGKRFLVSVGSKEDRYRASFGTRLEAEQAELAELLRRKQGGSPAEAPKAAPKVPAKATTRDTAKGKTLQDAFDLTFRLEWLGTKSEKTMSINGNSILRELGPDTLVGDVTTEAVTEAIIELEDKGNSGSTVNRKLSTLSVMLKTAIDHGWLQVLPKIPRRKEGKHRIRWMDSTEEGLALAKCEALGLYDLKDFIVVAVDTGFRRSELLGLAPADFSNGMLHLHAGNTKNDDGRAVPATSRVAEVLNRRADNRKVFDPLTVSTLRFQWGVLKETMGLEDDPQFLVHMLRHTCASRMVQKGVPLAVVQRWMGHKNINTTLRYAHLAPDNLMQAKNILEGIVGTPMAPMRPTAVTPELATTHDF